MSTTTDNDYNVWRWPQRRQWWWHPYRWAVP
jgi:hypothetical protein